jgi:hypothetical protein
MRSRIPRLSLFVVLIVATVLVLVSQRTNGWAAQDHAPATRMPLPPPEELAKLPSDGGPEHNRLVFEKSPYLLQHARNPVDWYPWGKHAFEKARKEDKPIFLSIGYSTCHWCHVMEHESFEDPEVAKLMNEHFVNIKLDREERPDVDNVYMTVCQAMTGGGGWPLTIVMTPDKKPFFAGTYFPKEGRFGRPGMLELVPQLGNAWNNRRAEILQSADQITARLQQITTGSGGKDLGPGTLDNAFNQLSQRFDEQRGGFGGGGNKFPIPHNLTFLLRYWKRSGDERAVEMVEKTLQAMRAGGIFDHVGFGFHRYSTDPEWLVPHFEKMLYDQALLTIAYVEAYQATGKPEYAQTAHEILTYVLRDMAAPQGGFYSAEDADSEGVEGKFYLWTDAQIDAALEPDDAKLVKRVFNFRSGGNFRNPHTPPKTNIFHLTKSLAEQAGALGMPEGDLRSRLEAARQKLFEAREQRVHPHKDDKVLTDWNGLMIAALAKAARVLDEPKYAAAAERAADFVLTTLRDEHGRLLKRYRDGEAGLPAHLEDYAFFVWGLLELYETTFDVKYLTTARKLNRNLIARFWDEEHGGFFFTADDSEELITRSKEIYDGAIPSGNSVAMLNLLRLGRITGESKLEQMAAAIGRAFSGQVARSASGHTQLMSGLDFGVGPSYEVVIAGDPETESLRTMLKTLRREFVPNKVVLVRPCGPEDPPIVGIAEFTQNQTSLNGKATAYVCRNYACELPTTDPQAMQAMLKRLAGRP